MASHGKREIKQPEVASSAQRVCHASHFPSCKRVRTRTCIASRHRPEEMLQMPSELVAATIYAVAVVLAALTSVCDGSTTRALRVAPRGEAHRFHRPQPTDPDTNTDDSLRGTRAGTGRFPGQTTVGKGTEGHCGASRTQSKASSGCPMRERTWPTSIRRTAGR